MLKELVKLANHLDSKGFYKEASYIDDLIRSNYDFDTDGANFGETPDLDPVDQITLDNSSRVDKNFLNYDQIMGYAYSLVAILSKVDELVKEAGFSEGIFNEQEFGSGSYESIKIALPSEFYFQDYSKPSVKSLKGKIDELFSDFKDKMREFLLAIDPGHAYSPYSLAPKLESDVKMHIDHMLSLIDPHDLGIQIQPDLEIEDKIRLCFAEYLKSIQSSSRFDSSLNASNTNRHPDLEYKMYRHVIESTLDDSDEFIDAFAEILIEVHNIPYQTVHSLSSSEIEDYKNTIITNLRGFAGDDIALVKSIIKDIANKILEDE